MAGAQRVDDRSAPIVYAAGSRLSSGSTRSAYGSTSSLNLQGTPRRLRVPHEQAAAVAAPLGLQRRWRAPTACARRCRARAPAAAARRARRVPPAARAPAAATPRATSARRDHAARCAWSGASARGYLRFRARAKGSGHREVRRDGGRAPRACTAWPAPGTTPASGKAHPLARSRGTSASRSPTTSSTGIASSPSRSHSGGITPVPSPRSWAACSAALRRSRSACAAAATSGGWPANSGCAAHSRANASTPIASIRSASASSAARRAARSPASARPGLAETSTSRRTRSGTRSASASASRPPIE